MYEDRVVAALEAVADRQRAAEHGWALDLDLRAVKQRVFNLAERGLTELADREERAALSAWEGRAVRWAARLTPCGHDLLLYSRFRPQPAESTLGPGLRRVELIPSQMTALRFYMALADRLRVPPADGLAEKIRTARRDASLNRHVLYLSPEGRERGRAWGSHLGRYGKGGVHGGGAARPGRRSRLAATPTPAPKKHTSH